MLEALLGVLALFAASVVLFWLAARTFRARQVVLRWIGVVLLGLLGLVIGVVGIVAAIGFQKVYWVGAPPAPDFIASTDPQVIARGEHLATILCVDCHSPDNSLPLSGGRDLATEVPLPLGFAPAYNLTPAGPLKDWTDGEIFRAIRHNVDPGGYKLAFMNATGIGTLGDEDIQALVAFLRSQPATGEELRKEKWTLLAYVMLGSGMIPQYTRPDQIATLPPAPTVEYGEYIVSFLSCRDCHGPDLRGSAGGLGPPGPSIVDAASNWTEVEFETALRTGKTPKGRQIVEELMPWKTYSQVDDTEMKAIYAYLRSLNQPLASQ